MYLCLHPKRSPGKRAGKSQTTGPGARVLQAGRRTGRYGRFWRIHMQTKAGALAPNIDFASRTTAAAASLRIPFLATPAAPSAGAPAALDPRVSKPDGAGSALQTPFGSGELAYSGASVFVPTSTTPSRAAVTAASPRGGSSPQGLTVDPAQNPLSSAGVDAVHPVDITAAVAVSPSNSAGASGTTTGLPSLAYPTPFSAVAVSALDPSPRASLASAAVRWCGGEGSGRPLTVHLPHISATA
jgi:hypothetical protein